MIMFTKFLLQSRSRSRRKCLITHDHDHDDGKSFQSRTITRDRDRDRDRDREIDEHAKHYFADNTQQAKKIEVAFLKVEPVFYRFSKKYEEMNKIYKILCFGYHLCKF